MKKIISFFIAILMMLTLSLVVFAEETTVDDTNNSGEATDTENTDGDTTGGETPTPSEPKGEIVVSSDTISKIYKPDGSEGSFNGGHYIDRVFDGNFDEPIYMNTTGSYIITDLNSTLAGGYYVTKITIGHAGNTAYSLYYSVNNAESWIPVVENVTTAGKNSYTINDMATQVKYVFETVIGWTPSLCEIEIKGIDPVEIGCFHRNLSEWTPVEGSATCTQKGKDVQTCLDCQEKIYRDSTTILANGHAFVSTVVESGKGLITCQACDFNLEIVGEVDFLTLGGVKTEGLFPFTNVSVSSTGNEGWGQRPQHMFNGGWSTDWGDYWYPATNNDEEEYILYEFGTEVDITLLDIALFNRDQTLKIYYYDTETGNFTLAREVYAYNQYIPNDSAYRFEVDLTGISTTAIKIQVYGPDQMRVCELHLYGTAKGATGAHRHNYTEMVEAIVEQTCAVTGKYIYKCNGCERTSEVYKPATENHSYTIFTAVVIEAGCATEGTSTFKCETCDGTKDITIDPTGDHKYTVYIDVAYENGYCQAGKVNYRCSGCVATSFEPINALFIIDGYSIKEDGTAITCDYDVNVETINKYKTLTGKSVSFGIFIAGAKKLTEVGSIFNSSAEAASVDFVISEMDQAYEAVSVTIFDMASNLSQVDVEFVMGLFLNIDGEIVEEQGNSALNTILDGKYNTISVRRVAELTNLDGKFDNTILAVPRKDEE